MSTPHLTKNGHQSAEAFCLMWYACRECGHCECIWNSRDGVTPFCMGCPSCGKPEMNHIEWQLDEYAPHHKPRRGQRIWASMTMERATVLAKRMLARHKPDATDDEVQDLARDYFGDGNQPTLRIHGYTEVDE